MVQKQAICINKLYAIMKKMKADTGIPVEKRITPYSARKRLIQTLNDSDIPAHQIVQVSGHKNINSLNNYSKLNPEQSKKISNILVTGKSPAHTGDAERASVPPSQSAVPLNQANPLLHTGQYVPPPYPVPLHYSQYVPSPFLNQCLPTELSRANAFQHPFPMLVRSIFNGPVTFQFESTSSNSKSVTNTQTAVCTQERSCSSSLEPRRWKRMKCISDSSEDSS